ncbi:hypothetical protein PG987_000600 [Apiospora arundinis]
MALPDSVNSAADKTVPRDAGLLHRPDRNSSAHLDEPLHTPRLDQIHAFLWLAGLPQPARPLHRQRLLQRDIVVTERVDEHLVWHEQRIFVKPLPEALLVPDVWSRESAAARGLLLSYTWLVAYASDLRIAVDLGLLPPATTWPVWAALAADVHRRVDAAASRGAADIVDRRYRYGELRLSRLNALYRLGFAGAPYVRNAVFGFMSQPTRYNAFFERNFSWIIISFVYITAILSTMQVALSTERLAKNTIFQDFSYCICIISLSFILLALVLLATVWAVLFWYHLSSTRRNHQKSALSWQKLTI